MTQSEQLRCNICGLALDSSEAKIHASSSSHVSLKQKLEHDLAAVKEEKYANDSSVILQWKNSV